MGCRLRYMKGTQVLWAFNSEATLVPMSRTYTFREDGVRNRRRDVWRIREVIETSSELDCKTKIQNYLLAMTDGGNLVLYQTTGQQETAHRLDSIRVLSVDFPEPTGPELAVQRTVETSVEAWVDLRSDNIVRWEEQLSFSGGGPRKMLVEVITGAPKGPYTTCGQTARRCTQSGLAVGRSSWPDLPGAAFADHLIEDPVDTKSFYRTEDGRLRFVRAWEYVMEAATGLGGQPTTWLGSNQPTGFTPVTLQDLSLLYQATTTPSSPAVYTYP